MAPATGETVWYVSNGVSKPFFKTLLRDFAQEVGAGRERTVVLVLDNAGWHSAPGLSVPEGLRLVYLPPYSPELQPAETLWPLVDEPVVNQHIATLEDLRAIVDKRCLALAGQQDTIKSRTNLNWWPAHPQAT